MTSYSAIRSIGNGKQLKIADLKDMNASKLQNKTKK